MCLPAVLSHSSVLSALPLAGYGLISAAVSSSCILADTRLLWPSATVAYRRVQCSARCCSLLTCQLLASWSSRTACHTTSSPTIRSFSSAWTAPTPRRPSTATLTYLSKLVQTNAPPRLWALPMLRCWLFLAYTPNWPVALLLLQLHPPGTLYLLTFDCAKTFSLSNATWKPICLQPEEQGFIGPNISMF